MSAIDWTGAKNAVHAWFVAATGLAPERILWNGQPLNRPAGSGAWISIRWKEDQSIGSDWTDYEENPSPTSGAELLSKTRGNRRFVLEATCYPPTPDDGVVADASEAMTILSDVKSRAALPAQSRALRAGGVSLSNVGNVIPIDGMQGASRFAPRALMTIILFGKSEITSTETIIEHVNAEIDVDGEPWQTINVDLTTE